jgi:lysophospholipase L1-like esterase
MSEPTERPRAASWFSPGFFLAGLVVGFLGLVGAGHWAAQHNTHPGAARLHPRVSPEGNYLPTVDELCAMVRARCRPDQILVIIGGNSILNGVGQPVEKLWTAELQNRLGDRYAVVNLAMRGAESMDGGAVIAEVLRKEFPRQIYVANAAPFTQPAPLGQKAYHYIFLEAYYRGLLEDFAPRHELVKANFTQGPGQPWLRRWQAAAEVRLDAALKYRDLWNWVGYEHFFTIPSFHTPRWPALTVPRGRLLDEEPDFEAMAFNSGDRFAMSKTEVELKIVRGFSVLAYQPGGPEGWTLDENARAQFRAAARTAMPDDLKSRTIIMLSRNSPYYVKMLTPEEIKRDDLAYRDGVAAWKEAGYGAAEYGRDFAPEDYGDRTHLTASGGRRLAEIVAGEVATLAKKLGYQTKEASP